jgi:hypothetical protein
MPRALGRAPQILLSAGGLTSGRRAIGNKPIEPDVAALGDRLNTSRSAEIHAAVCSKNQADTSFLARFSILTLRPHSTNHAASKQGR